MKCFRSNALLINYTIIDYLFILKDKSRVGVIEYKIQDNTAINGASYFLDHFSPFPCGSTYSNRQFERTDIISFKRKRGHSFVFSPPPFNRC